MKRADRLVTRLCCRILWDAMDWSKHMTVQTIPVRLALHALLPYLPERWPLTNFWEAAGTEQDIGRSQGTAASYRAILNQLERAGLGPPAYSSLEPPEVDEPKPSS